MKLTIIFIATLGAALAIGCGASHEGMDDQPDPVDRPQAGGGGGNAAKQTSRFDSANAPWSNGSSGSGGASMGRSGSGSSSGSSSSGGSSGSVDAGFFVPIDDPFPDPQPTSAVPTCDDVPSDVASRWLAFDSDREGYNRDLYLVRGDGSELTRLTEEPSTEREPAFAPDGKHLAYTSDKSGSMQIYIRDMVDGTSEQLTQRDEGADQSSWSRDGKQLVFHSGPSVFIIDADGSDEHEIARGLDDFNAFKYPSLSLDGTAVVFDRNNEIDAIDLDGTNMRYVVQNTTTDEETPSVSPDGYNVAFAVSCTAFGEQISVAPFLGDAADPCGAAFVTSSTIGRARRPAWGPHDYIAFERRDNGRDDSPGGTRITIVAGPGAEACDIVEGPAQNGNPSWAPEGFEP